jgi:hypothetical protein
MVERHLSLPYNFVCFTDDASGINPAIEIQPIPNINVLGWWNKLWFLSEDFPLSGTVLFLDLDLVIFRSIDCLFDFNPSKFCIVRDFTRQQIPTWKKMNSSVFRFESHVYSDVYNFFNKNKKSFTARYSGDQDYLYDQIKEFEFWPDEWVMSYKWEMRNRTQLVKTANGLNFRNDEPPTVNPETAIAVFHGKPNPHECKDSWVIQHWH